MECKSAANTKDGNSFKLAMVMGFCWLAWVAESAGEGNRHFYLLVAHFASHASKCEREGECTWICACSITMHACKQINNNNKPTSQNFPVRDHQPVAELYWAQVRKDVLQDSSSRCCRAAMPWNCTDKALSSTGILCLQSIGDGDDSPVGRKSQPCKRSFSILIQSKA